MSQSGWGRLPTIIVGSGGSGAGIRRASQTTVVCRAHAAHSRPVPSARCPHPAAGVTVPGAHRCPDKGVPMQVHRPLASLLVTVGTAAAVVLTVVPASASPGGGRAAPQACTSSDAVRVPGAEHTETACLPDITTAGLRTAPPGKYTDQADWSTLSAPNTTNPTGVRGLQVD